MALSYSARSGQEITKTRSFPIEKLALHATLWKFVDLGLWNHAYAGEQVVTNPLSGIITIIWLTFSSLLIFSNFDYLYRFWANYKLLSIYIVFCIFHSIFLSISPVRSVQFSIYCLIITFAVYVNISKNGQDIFNQIKYFCFVFLFLNFLSFFFTQYSIMVGRHSGLFRGFTVHKNDFAFYIYIISTLALVVGNNISRAIIIIVSSFYLYVSFSVQSIIMAIAAVTIFITLELYKKFGIYIIPMIVSLFLILVILYLDESFRSNFFYYFGRDDSFTGRDQIWDFFIDDISRKNFLGYGLGAFFTDENLVSQLVGFGVRFLLNTGHSSYLDAYVSLGWVGGTLFFVLVLSYVFKSIYLSIKKKTHPVAPVLILTLALGGITATEKLLSPGLGWMAFVIAIMVMNENTVVKRFNSFNGGKRIARSSGLG